MTIFGFDFDNTLINYNKVFYNLAIKKKLIKKKTSPTKEIVKKVILKNNNVSDWVKLQSEVYSYKINEAIPNKKFISIFKILKKKNIKFYIVSHKTKYPYHGKKIDLHKISLNWLKKNFFNKKNNIKACDCYFEGTQRKKISRIKKLKISHFVDDLKKVLDLVPNDVVKILYKQDNFKINKITKLIK